MSKCKFCGSELQEGMKFCSTCGAKADETPVADGIVMNSPKESDEAGKVSKRPLHGGVLAWSIVNIAAGLGACCCFAPFVSLVLGIVGLVYTLLATNCQAEQIEKSRIRTAKILNLIATCITVISIIVYVILIVLSFIASGGLEELLPYYYYFD